MGHSFNLKIRLENGQRTWDVLDQFFADAPDDIIEYTQNKNLLDNPYWSAVRSVLLESNDLNLPLGSFNEEHDDATQIAVLRGCLPVPAAPRFFSR